MENHNFSWEKTISMAMFHSYVKLPEGNHFFAQKVFEIFKTRKVLNMGKLIHTEDLLTGIGTKVKHHRETLINNNIHIQVMPNTVQVYRIHACIHTLHCITLHYIALHCITLQYITLHYIKLHHIT